MPLTLRQNGVPLSYTTLPVVSGSSGQQPTATTTAATSISSTGATLNGTVNPNGLSTSVWFQWGTTTALGQNTGTGTASGTTASAWTSTLTGLTANTTYYFRIAAQNSAGTSYGSILSFTTTATGQTNPFNGHALQINGTVTLEGHTVQIKVLADLTWPSLLWAEADSSNDWSSLVSFGILFDQGATFSGNTANFTGVTATASYYANFYKSYILHNVVSGTLTITLSSTTVGTSASGQLTFKLDDGTSIQSNISGTLVSYN